MISLKTFLTVLFRYCDAQQLDCMFARLYKAENLTKFKKNIAVFVPRAHRAAIIKMLRVWPDIEVMGMVRHPTFTRVHLHGIKQGQCRFLALDMHHEASYEGTPYLNLSNILLRKVESACGIGFEPHPVDLALITLFEDILKPRIVPDKARQTIIRTLKSDRANLHDALMVYGGVDAPAHLDNIIDIYDQHAMRKLIASFRRFAYQTESVGALINRAACYIGQAYQAIFARGDLHIAVVGTDGSGKTTLVNNLAPLLRNSRDQLVQYAMLPRLHDKISNLLPLSHSKPRAPILSHIILLYQFITCWLAQIMPRRYSRTIIYDGYIGALNIDPQSAGYTGSRRFAQWLLRYLPAIDVVVWMATPPSIAHKRNGKTDLSALTRNYALYKEFTEQAKTHLVYTTTTDMDEFIKQLCMLMQERVTTDGAV